MLNELEKAHIYIERLHEQAQEKDQRIGDLEQRLDARQAGFARRLSRLEALIRVSPPRLRDNVVPSCQPVASLGQRRGDSLSPRRGTIPVLHPVSFSHKTGR